MSYLLKYLLCIKVKIVPIGFMGGGIADRLVSL
jgi:hypothetical protein